LGDTAAIKLFATLYLPPKFIPADVTVIIINYYYEVQEVKVQSHRRPKLDLGIILEPLESSRFLV